MALGRESPRNRRCEKRQKERRKYIRWRERVLEGRYIDCCGGIVQLRKMFECWVLAGFDRNDNFENKVNCRYWMGWKYGSSLLFFFTSKLLFSEF